MFSILRRLINFIALIIELLLLFRLVLKFVGANAATPFVGWIYGVTASLVSPFAKILPNWKYENFVIDFATLAAIIVYAIATYLLLMLIPSPAGRKHDA